MMWVTFATQFLVQSQRFGLVFERPFFSWFVSNFCEITVHWGWDDTSFESLDTKQCLTNRKNARSSEFMTTDYWQKQQNTVNNAVILARLRLRFVWSWQVRGCQEGSEEVKGVHWGGWGLGGSHGGGTGTNQEGESTRLLSKQSEL